MVLWQCDLRVSWQAQWLSLLVHGIVATAILLLPWPLSYMPVWLLLIAFVVFDCVRSQRRIHARQGELALLDDDRLRWQGKVWELSGRPLPLPGGMLLRLKCPETRKRQLLWLAADCLREEEWRNLRRLLRTRRARDV